jgi:hypothetical protein
MAQKSKQCVYALRAEPVEARGSGDGWPRGPAMSARPTPVSLELQLVMTVLAIHAVAISRRRIPCMDLDFAGDARATVSYQ